MTKWKLLVTSVLLLIAAACLLLWLGLTGAMSDFGLNAATETLGILITVLIVDQLIKRHEEVRLLPQQAAAYEDVRLLTSRIVIFWAETYKSCVPGAAPESVEELFGKESLKKVYNNLNMDSKPNAIPTQTWWKWFPHNMTEFRKLGGVILERHNTILDPQAYSTVHKITTNMVDPYTIAIVRKYDVASGFPRPKVLSSYWVMTEEYGDAVITLVKWCEARAKRLEAAGIRDLKQVTAQIYKWDEQTSPPCMIDPDELQRQIRAVEEFRENNKTIKY